jgi:hypothetical protein
MNSKNYLTLINNPVIILDRLEIKNGIPIIKTGKNASVVPSKISNLTKSDLDYFNNHKKRVRAQRRQAYC